MTDSKLPTKKRADTGVVAYEQNKYEVALIDGDLSKLDPEERVDYYNAVCRSTGLNPLTKPFEYVKLNGQLRLYARRDATDQLRKIHGVDLRIISKQQVGDLYIVEVEAKDREGRKDTAIGAVSLKGLGGEALANALMKAESKAKRRVTLSLCGLGMLDETEVESVKQVERQKAKKPQPTKTADIFKEMAVELGLPEVALRDFAKANGIVNEKAEERMLFYINNQAKLQEDIGKYIDDTLEGDIE